MHPFQQLAVWRRAHSLSVELYRATQSWTDFGLRSQLRRAAVSIGSNIAEGAGGVSQAQFARFLGIALGSAAELRSLLFVARDVGMLDAPTHTRFDVECEGLRRMLTALHSRIKEAVNS